MRTRHCGFAVGLRLTRYVSSQCAKCLKKMKPKAPRKPRPPKDKDAPATPAASSSTTLSGTLAKPTSSSPKKAKAEAGPSVASSGSLPPTGLVQPVQTHPSPAMGPVLPALGAPPWQRPYQQPIGPLQQQSQHQPPSYYQTGQAPRGYYARPNAAPLAYSAYSNQQTHGMPPTYGGNPGPQAYYPQPHLQNGYPSYPSAGGHPSQGYPYQQPLAQAQLPMASPYGHAGSHNLHRPSLPSSVSSERGSMPAGLPQGGVPYYATQQAPLSMQRPPSFQTHKYAPGTGFGQPVESHPAPHAQLPPPPAPRRTSGHAPSLSDLMSPPAVASQSLPPLAPNGLPQTNGQALPPPVPTALPRFAPPPA